MSLDLDTPVFKHFDKDNPNWVKLGKYVIWLFTTHVPERPGMSGVFALKVSPARDNTLQLSADFWCAPFGTGFCCSIIGSDELDTWMRSVKYLEHIRKQIVERKSKTLKRKKK